MTAVLGWVLIGTGALFVGLALPLILGKVPMNHVYGARFQASFESEESWFRINRYAGRQLAYAAIPLAALGLAALLLPLPESDLVAVLLALSPVPVALFGALRSYRYANSLSTKP